MTYKFIYRQFFLIFIFVIAALLIFNNPNSYAFKLNLKKMVESLEGSEASSIGKSNNKREPKITKDIYFDTIAKHMNEMAESGSAMAPSYVAVININLKKNGVDQKFSVRSKELIYGVLKYSYKVNFDNAVGSSWYPTLYSYLADTLNKIDQFYFSTYIAKDNLPSKYSGMNRITPEKAQQKLQKSIKNFNKAHGKTSQSIMQASMNFLNDYNEISDKNFQNVSEKIKHIQAEQEKKRKEAEAAMLAEKKKRLAEQEKARKEAETARIAEEKKRQQIAKNNTTRSESPQKSPNQNQGVTPFNTPTKLESNYKDLTDQMNVSMNEDLYNRLVQQIELCARKGDYVFGAFASQYFYLFFNDLKSLSKNKVDIARNIKVADNFKNSRDEMVMYYCNDKRESCSLPSVLEKSKKYYLNTNTRVLYSKK